TAGAAAFGAVIVVNWLEKSARWLPDRSCTPLVATTVTVVDPGSVPPYSVTVRLSAEIEFTPPTRAVPFTNSAIVLLPFTVAAFSDFENVTTTHGFNPTPVAPFDGVTLTTVGGVVSAVAAVVKLHWYPTVFPTRSVIPYM